MRRFVYMGASLMLLAACQQAETPQQMQTRMDQETAAAKKSIAAIAARYEGWTAAGQTDSIANAFTENGREMPPNAPAVVGRAAIRADDAAQAAAMTRKLTVMSESVVSNGPIAIERGTYRFEATAKKGAPKGTPASITDSGKYLQHWQNVNGTWLIAEQVWNSDIPLGPPPAPPKEAAKAAAKAPAKAPARKK